MLSINYLIFLDKYLLVRQDSHWAGRRICGRERFITNNNYWNNVGFLFSFTATTKAAETDAPDRDYFVHQLEQEVEVAEYTYEEMMKYLSIEEQVLNEGTYSGLFSTADYVFLRNQLDILKTATIATFVDMYNHYYEAIYNYSEDFYNKYIILNQVVYEGHYLQEIGNIFAFKYTF